MADDMAKGMGDKVGNAENEDGEYASDEYLMDYEDEEHESDSAETLEFVGGEWVVYKDSQTKITAGMAAENIVKDPQYGKNAQSAEDRMNEVVEIYSALDTKNEPVFQMEELGDMPGERTLMEPCKIERYVLETEGARESARRLTQQELDEANSKAGRSTSPCRCSTCVRNQDFADSWPKRAREVFGKDYPYVNQK